LIDDKAEKMGQGKSASSLQRRGWLLGIAGILLLFCMQPLLSAKTLLEQYLNCDGFEEFVFYHEYPGKTDQYPSMYWSGSFQDGHSLFIFTRTPQAGVPDTLSTNQSLSLSACFEDTWWSFNVSSRVFDRKIWEEKNDPREEGNSVQQHCLGGIKTIKSYLLNFGLDHSENAQMTKGEGVFTNQNSQVVVDYKVTETNTSGMPTMLIAHARSLKELFPPATWKNIVTYQDDGEIPAVIDRFYVNGEGKEDELTDRIVIQKVVPAKTTLSKEHFLRPAFENADEFPKDMVTTFYLQTNKFVGMDSKSNQIVRMSPNDPRLLHQVDEKNLIRGYWIVAILMTILAGGIIFKFRNNK
jgi:hypothetical protein